jgi:hypothetical protein
MAATRLSEARLRTVLPGRLLLPLPALFAACGMSVALSTGSMAAAMVGFAALGAGVALVVPTAFRAAGGGTAIGIVAALGWTGFVSGPPLIGRLAGLIGLTSALWLLPALCIVIAAATLCCGVYRGSPSGVADGRAAPGLRRGGKPGSARADSVPNRRSR